MTFFYIVIGPILNAVISILTIYKYILIIAIFLSWLRPDPYNPIVRFIISITEPVLNKIRKMLPLRFGMIDFSPIALFVLIQIVQGLLEYFLKNIR